MKTVIITCTYTANELVFWQLRLMIESVLREVPRDQYFKLLVVDDHSPETQYYNEFRDHYKNDDRIEFLMLGHPLPSFMGKNSKGPDKERPQTSDGPGVAMHKGFLHAKELGATHVWTLDSDTLVLNGSCLGSALELFQKHPEVRSVGDYEYGRPGEREGLVFKSHRFVGGKQTGRFHEREGITNGICGLWSLEDYGFEYDHPSGHRHAAQFENRGQVGYLLVCGLWERGFASAYYPFFWGGHVVHFGYGTVLFTREQMQVSGIGNSLDHRKQYGGKGKEIRTYYAGFLQLKCGTTEYHNHLRTLYQGRPFSDLSARFDTNLLVAPE